MEEKSEILETEKIAENAATETAAEPDEMTKMRLENEQLRLKLKIMEQDERNRARSAGSVHTEGQRKPYDPFDEVWG